ncbi:MAG: PLP-dependent aminotransferase family protein [Clostridia bacterium]|nr:PLP-dependent aminotransferase family protein [Clostridia bacterium]
MRYVLDMKAGRPAYLQIYELLRQDIVSGVYPHGAKLPSKRSLAADLGVSLSTVEHALELLVEEGYAGTRERSGCFAIYRAADQFAAAPAGQSHKTHTVLGDTAEAFPFSVLARTMRRVLAECGAEILVKSESNGCAELRRAICAYLARNRGLAVGPEQVVIGAGAEYLYGLVVQLLGRERIFAVEDPCYEKIRAVYTANGICFEPLPLGPEGIPSDTLAETAATVLHVTPYNSYPSGVTATASKRREYIAFAEARGGYVIEDDFDSEFTPSAKPQDTLFSLDTAGRTVYINTFTKTVAPAIRVGYMVLPPALLAEFQHRLGGYSCTVPTFEQYVLAELLDSGDFERHINRQRRKKRRTAEK